MYNQTINLNMIPSGVPPVIHVSQYEHQLNAFTFKLYNGSSVYNIPSNVAVLINGVKPDKNVFSFSAASYSGNTVICNCERQMVAVAGATVCELRLRSASEIIGTCNFILQVEAAPLHDDSVISETMIPLIEQAVDIAANLAEYIETTLTASREAISAAEAAALSASEASVYNSNVEQTYASIETAKRSANTAAQNAQTVADTVQAAYQSGALKGDKGDKGDTGDSGISQVVNGLYMLYVESDTGNLYVLEDDSSDIGDNFEYNNETGELDYVFTWADPEPTPDPSEDTGSTGDNTGDNTDDNTGDNTGDEAGTETGNGGE